MTTQYAVLPARSGRSYTAKLFTVADPDTEVTGNTITVTERTNAKGMFRAGIARASALPAGDYILVYLYGTLGAAVGYFTFAGTDGETASETPVTVELDSASRDAVADAVWDEAMSGHTTSGTYGARVVRGANSNVEVQITGSQHVAADVHEFQAGVITAGDFANNSLTAAALAADAVAEIQNGLSTLTASQVNAEVVDALSVDTYAELTAPPAATSSLKDKLTWLFMYARNKVTQTATQRKLYRDDGTTVAGTSGTTDDGTTFTKGEDA